MNQLLMLLTISVTLSTVALSEQAKPDSTKEFWRWFEARSQAYSEVFGAENQSAAVDEEETHNRIQAGFREIGQELRKVHPKFVLFIVPADDDLALTVTVYGDAEMFDAVDDLIELAPPIKGWNFKALKSPYMAKFVTTGDSANNLVTFRTSNLKYTRSRNADRKFDLVIYVPEKKFDSIDRSDRLARSPEQQFRSHIGEMVGERLCSTIITAVKIAPLDEDAPKGLLPLTRIYADLAAE